MHIQVPQIYYHQWCKLAGHLIENMIHDIRSEGGAAHGHNVSYLGLIFLGKFAAEMQLLIFMFPFLYSVNWLLFLIWLNIALSLQRLFTKQSVKSSPSSECTLKINVLAFIFKVHSIMHNFT